MSTTADRPTAGPSYDELADRFFAAIMTGDLDTVRTLYDVQLEVWHNYDELNQTKEQNLRSLQWFTATLGPLQYVEVQRTVLPDGFWQQHVTELRRDGVTTRIPAALRAFYRNGKIVRIEEYLDPAPVNALLAARKQK